MKKRKIFILAMGMMLAFGACGRNNVSPEDERITTEAEKNEVEEKEPEEVSDTDHTETGSGQEVEEMKLQIEAGGSTFTAVLEENQAAAALVEMIKDEPMVIEMEDYAGFEKVGSLGTSLPASNSQMTARAGDIVLYNSSQIVMFYGSNSWSYTKLAEVEDLTGWEDALGSGSVSVTLSVE